MSRKIVVRKSKANKSGPKVRSFPRPSYGGGGTTKTRLYWCTWCWERKGTPTEKCGTCAKFTPSSTTPHSSVSQVYLEDNPITLEP